MRRNLASKTLCLVVALVLLGSGMVAAQQITGEIEGVITDSSGNGLPGVTVTVKNQATGITRSVITDTTGSYKAKALQAGNYEVTAALEGLQTTRQSDVIVLTGQIIDINLTMEVESTSEVITVTAESPLIEVSRSSAANYVDEVAIENLPIQGRDFTNFALLTPTVQRDNVRGFVTMSGQRGIYTDLNVDGANNKSTFFGYGRGGEATENEGLVIAQDAVKEFKVVVNEFSPEYGRSGGGSINVITKSGTNQFQGGAFWQYRDDSGAADLPSSPLDDFRGRDGSRPVDTFERNDYGVSFGGPIVKDRTHFFLAGDIVDRQEPFGQSIDTATNWDGCGTPGSTNCLSVYDAIMLRAQTDNPAFADLLTGFDRQADGSALGTFNRTVDNTILFGKIDHQFSNSQQASLRINWTDFERSSDYLDEESLKTEDTISAIGSWTSIIGNKAVNEFRFQYAEDNLDRLSKRVGQPIEAEVRFQFADFDSVGKFDFLPILAEETQLQVKNDFSYLFGAHDAKFGIDYSKDDLAQLFAGSLDGRYDYGSIDDFLNNNARSVRIYFGNVHFPNYDESQESLGLYAQDSWRRGDLTLNYGIRYEAEYNPDNLDHLFPEGRSIPDDTDNFGPRIGFAWSPSSKDVLRGGAGLFFGRTATLLFASQVQENGIFPNYGRQVVGPGDPGFVQLGNPIPNENPPMDIDPATSYVDPSWELAEVQRYNVGYEREIARNWSAGVDVIYAEGDKLQRNDDLNRQIDRYDEFGRPIYSSTRPIPGLQTIFVRQSNGESKYTAVTLKVNKRWADRYSFGAHYTWSEDKDDDSNERSATTVTITDPTNLRYDYGISDRNVENRFLAQGVVELPFEIRISGVFEYKDGLPYTALEQSGIHNFPGFNGPFGGSASYAVINGQLVGRNTYTNEDITTFDLRLSKFFTFGSRYEVDLYVQAFNLFDQNSFSVGQSQADPTLSDGSANPEFGIPSGLVTQQRQFEFGARFNF